MYLLDTDILIWVLRGRKDIVEKISQLKEQETASISVMSIAEIYKNIFPSELTTVEDFLDQHVLFDIDQKIAKLGGLYWQQYSKTFKTLSIADCLIAATANEYELTVVTLKVKHFPMKDIKVINPLDQ